MSQAKKLTGSELERAYRAALMQVHGVGPATLGRILKLFGSGEAVWQASEKMLVDTLGEGKLVEALVATRAEVDVELFYLDLVRMGVRVLCLGLDEEYPENLAAIKQPPQVLYVRGALDVSDDRAVAVIGSRKPTEYGLGVTDMLVRGLVEAGVTIVSGLARGIDGAAHRAALEYGGRTVAVLGTGIESIYPAEHEELASKMMASGAVVSSFAPGAAVQRGQFAVRNRYVAGLSLGVLVIEGASKSGTRITAEYAMKQDKSVFAVPGNITHINSAAPSELIQEGAQLVTSAEDILEHLGISAGQSGGGEKWQQAELREVQQRVVQAMQEGVRTADELCQTLEVPMRELSVELTMLEMEGVVKRVGEEYQLI